MKNVTEPRHEKAIATAFVMVIILWSVCYSILNGEAKAQQHQSETITLSPDKWECSMIDERENKCVGYELIKPIPQEFERIVTCKIERTMK